MPGYMVAETKLAQAARHVAEGKRIVAKQRQLICRTETGRTGHHAFRESLGPI
jgi:hypothetical protein